MTGRLSLGLPLFFAGLFGQGLRAGDGEGGVGFGCRVLGLGCAESEGVRAGKNGAVALIVDARQRAGIEGDGDFFALPGGDGDPLKADKRVDGAVGLRSLEVGFDDLVAGD